MGERRRRLTTSLSMARVERTCTFALVLLIIAIFAVNGEIEGQKALAAQEKTLLHKLDLSLDKPDKEQRKTDDDLMRFNRDDLNDMMGVHETIENNPVAQPSIFSRSSILGRKAKVPSTELTNQAAPKEAPPKDKADKPKEPAKEVVEGGIETKPSKKMHSGAGRHSVGLVAASLGAVALTFGM